MEDAIRKADVLIEALPYIQRFAGRPVVIKFGGAAMASDQVLDDVLEDIVFLAAVGIRTVVVHGGGPQISRAMEQAGLRPRFVRGHRVTDADALEVAVRVLVEEINADLVRRIKDHGGRGYAAFTGSRCPILARKKTARAEDGSEVDLGYVGEAHTVAAAELLGAAREGAVVVVPPVGRDAAGQLLNVNADTAAAAVAGALDAEKVVFLSNVHGIMARPDEPDSLLPTLAEDDVEKMVAEGTISGGMLPKVRACLSALEEGVPKAHIIDGRLPHSLLLEIFTDRGVGTQILKATSEG
ncbi:MAG: acetylglutamate kinase [Candidatus Brocadiia bacterium]